MAGKKKIEEGNTKYMNCKKERRKKVLSYSSLC